MKILVTDQQSLFDDNEIKKIGYDELEKGLNVLKGDIGCDLETEGFNAFQKRTITLQIGNFDVQYVIDMRSIPKGTLDVIRKFFREDDKLFLFHNAKFDLRFLMMLDIWPNKVYDSFLVESIMYQGIYWGKHPKGLADISMKYLGVALDKSVRGKIHWKGLDTEVVSYAADDVKYLPLIKQHQMEYIKKEQLERVVLLENEFVKVLSYIEMSGLLLDIPAWKKRIKEDKESLQKKIKQLDEVVINDNRFNKYVDNQLDLFSNEMKSVINWSSPTQCVKFFKDLGCDLKIKDKKTGNIKDSVDAKVLIPQKHIHPIIEIYLEYKTLDKMIGTYGDNWLKGIEPKTGRLHTQFKQLLDTARLSSGGKNKKTKEEYINFLNIPQDNRIRNCIIPKEGYVFVDADFASQEQICLANASKEPKLLEFYDKNLENGDMHTYICKQLWPELKDLPQEVIKTTHKDKRHMAKIAGFSINYGGVGATIAKNLSMDIETGDRVYETYMNAFPQLKIYFEQQKKFALTNGYILTDTVSKRRIYLDDFEEFKQLEKEFTKEFWDEYRIEKQKDSVKFKTILKPKVREYFMKKGDYERKSLNFPIQSQSASITKLACIYVYREIEKQNAFWKILFPNVIHDQIILEVPQEESQKWADTVQYCMEKAGEPFCKTVKLRAEPEILTKWKK